MIIHRGIVDLLTGLMAIDQFGGYTGLKSIFIHLFANSFIYLLFMFMYTLFFVYLYFVIYWQVLWCEREFQCWYFTTLSCFSLASSSIKYCCPISSLTKLTHSKFVLLSIDNQHFVGRDIDFFSQHERLLCWYEQQIFILGKTKNNWEHRCEWKKIRTTFIFIS